MPQKVEVLASSDIFSLHMPKSAILMCPSESRSTLSSFRSLPRRGGKEEDFFHWAAALGVHVSTS